MSGLLARPWAAGCRRRPAWCVWWHGRCPPGGSGCLSLDEASPVRRAQRRAVRPRASIAPPLTTRSSVGGAAYPERLLPPAADASAELLLSLLYDPLYRLDALDLAPRPHLAAELPQVPGTASPGPSGWRDGDLRLRGRQPADAPRTWCLAPASPSRRPAAWGASCAHAVAISVSRARWRQSPIGVALTLTEPYQPFLAEVLGRLPIVSEAAVRAATGAIVAAATGMDPGAPDAQVARIAEATNAEACLSDDPPFGCRLADHSAELEQTLTSVGLVPACACHLDRCHRIGGRRGLCGRAA